MKYLSLLGAVCLFGFSCGGQPIAQSRKSSVAQAPTATTSSSNISEIELKAFGQKIFDIYSRQAKDEYLALIHPDCPAPLPEAIESAFSSKWLANEAHDIRVKTVEEQYDMSQLSFKVKPQAALEFQTWTAGAGQLKEELVTGVPVAKYKGNLKVLEYPCFEPK